MIPYRDYSVTEKWKYRHILLLEVLEGGFHLIMGSLLHIHIHRNARILGCTEGVVIRLLEEICLLFLVLLDIRTQSHHPIVSTAQVGILEDLQW